MNDKIWPAIVFEHEKSYLFGLIKISILIENRNGTDIRRTFKHYISIRVFTISYDIIIRSNSEGYYSHNGKELDSFKSE